MLWPTSLNGQRIEADKFQHFVAGAGIEVVGKVVIPEIKPWKRVLITGTIGAAYELGQGRFDVWDLTADVLGGILVEVIW